MGEGSFPVPDLSLLRTIAIDDARSPPEEGGAGEGEGGATGGGFEDSNEEDLPKYKRKEYYIQRTLKGRLMVSEQCFSSEFIHNTLVGEFVKE